MRCTIALMTLVPLVSLLGCPSETPAAAPPATEVAPAPPPPVAAAGDAAAEAKQIFATRCTPCHGAGGAGDGPASAGLTPKPASFTNADWQRAITDEHIEKVITYGGMAVGKSAAMPPNPDLDGKPVVAALRAYVRSLAAP